MRQKRCKLCGCFTWTNDSDICECCLDDMDRSNPYTQWEREYDREEDEDNGK